MLSNLAHMGDVVLMTSLLPVLKKTYPQAAIGVLIGSWSLPLLKNHPLVDRIHIVDHWKLHRSPLSLAKKFVGYWKTKRKAMREIRGSSYDVAIDAYYYFPNAVPIFWKAKIPVRIGYTSGGFGPLLTHAVDWTNSNQSVVHYYCALIDFLNIPREEYFPLLRPSLPRNKSLSGNQYLQQNSTLEVSQGYIVIHIGPGSPLKEWPLENWQKLVAKLQNHPLIFTGKGEREKEQIDLIIQGRKGCINLADRLTWDEYTAILQDAKLLIGVDSVPGHLAACYGTPSVLIYSGMSNIHHWSPRSPHCTILTNHMPCSPCYRGQGCSTMSCIREVNVETVYAACCKKISLNS